MLPLLALTCLLIQSPVSPPFVDDSVASAALGRTMKYRVLLPDDYAQSGARYRALYLLHGLTGDYMDWSTRTDLARLAHGLPLVIVMPDGENAWYTNAANKGPRFEDYIADDLVKDVEQKYRVIRSRYGRAIAGLSMGGYGALKIALKRPGTFAAAGGFSSALGVTDPTFDDQLTAYKAQLYTIYGPAGSETRAANDILLIAGKAKPESAPSLYVDCGTSDGLLDESRALVALLGSAASSTSTTRSPARTRGTTGTAASPCSCRGSCRYSGPRIEGPRITRITRITRMEGRGFTRIDTD